MVSGILHLGNVLFREEGTEKAVIDADESESKFDENAISPAVDAATGIM